MSHRSEAASRPFLQAISDTDFHHFRALIYRESGIHLSEAKKALLIGRLSSRLRELGVPSFRAYFKRVEADAEERYLMLERICTHETHFFREPQHFTLLEKVLLPAYAAAAKTGRHPRRLRVWSAGCSSGQEPFSIAMLLLAHLPPEDGWTHEVLATDLSKRILDRASAAVWPRELAREIPDAYLKRFMLRGRGASEHLMKAGDELRSIVHFEQVNLSDRRDWPGGRFDLIFCRNVLIYFDPRSKAAVIDAFLDRLEPTGCFFVGHAESLTGLTSRVRSLMPTVYQLATGS